MSTLTYAVSDSATMLRRNLKHAKRYPALSLSTAGMPVIFLLLFVYVFGNALGDGIGGGGRAGYVNYLVPGVIMMTVASGTMSTAISVCTDMAEGIVARFRTMAIFRPSLMTGHVIGSMIQTLASLAVVFGISVLVGFRPTATPVEWLAVFGLLAALTFALTWLAVAFGLVSKTPEGASNLPLPLTLLPLIGSGFVPTDSMSSGLRWFAEYQPFTPAIETLRGLLMGTEIGNSAVIALGWCVAITLLGYFWSRSLFNRPI